MKCAGKANIEKSKGRSIERSEYQDYVDENIERVTQNKGISAEAGDCFHIEDDHIGLY